VMLRKRAAGRDARARSLPRQLTLGSLTVDEELGRLQLAGNTTRPVPARHGLPVLPGPGDPRRGRALDAAQQAHTLPDFDCHIAQGLGKVRGSWRREQQRRGSGSL